jgi:hypothetical protein
VRKRLSLALDVVELARRSPDVVLLAALVDVSESALLQLRDGLSERSEGRSYAAGVTKSDRVADQLAGFWRDGVHQ